MTMTYKNAPLLINEEFLDYATEAVAEALRYIYISTFKAEIIDKKRGEKLKLLFYILSTQAKKGVDVRLLINNISIRGTTPVSNFNAIRKCQEAGIKVRVFPNNRICHAKVIVVDDYKAIIGSHNLSVKSCRENFEVSYMLNSLHTIACLKQIYAENWDKANAV